MLQIIRYLNTNFSIPVRYEDLNGKFPIPLTAEYDPIRQISGKTISLTPIELIHNTARKFSTIHGSFFNSYFTNLVLGGFLLGYFDYNDRERLKSIENVNSDLKRFYSFPVGVAISCEVLKKLYEVPLSLIQPIPTSSADKSADFKVEKDSKLYLFEAKGSSGGYQHSAINKAKKQLAASKKKYNYSPDISIVISSKLDEYGTDIQITDPEFDYPYSPISPLGHKLSNYSDLMNFFSYAGYYKTAVQLDRIIANALKNIDRKTGEIRKGAEVTFGFDIISDDQTFTSVRKIDGIDYVGIGINYHPDLSVFQGIPKETIQQISQTGPYEKNILYNPLVEGPSITIQENSIVSIESDGSILSFTYEKRRR